MAKKDSIFNYSSAFDTSGYIAGVKSVWAANKSNAWDAGTHKFYSGTPAVDTTPPTGWEKENWKFLEFHKLVLDGSVDGSNDQGFETEAHRLVYDIKRAFNLPNQEDLSTWKDEYTCADGEHHLFYRTKAGTANMPYLNGASTDVDGTGDTLKCSLIMGIEGFSPYGGTDQEDSIDVRPSMGTQSVFDTHYKTQYDASTLPAAFTSPTLVGTEFTQVGNIILLNLETAWKGSDVVRTNDFITMNIVWSSHTYAQIKTIIDTAIA